LRRVARSTVDYVSQHISLKINTQEEGTELCFLLRSKLSTFDQMRKPKRGGWLRPFSYGISIGQTY